MQTDSKSFQIIEQITGNNNWTNLPNGRVIDGSIASCDFSKKDEVPNTIDFMGIPLPKRIESVITGIEIAIRKSMRSGDEVSDSIIQIINSAKTGISQNKANTDIWSTSLTDYIYGGVGDVWGLSLTSISDMVNDSYDAGAYRVSNWGLRFAPSGKGIANLDGISAKIYYTLNEVYVNGPSNKKGTFIKTKTSIGGTSCNVYVFDGSMWIPIAEV